MWPVNRASEIRQNGLSAIYVHADVSKTADCEKMVPRPKKAFGKLNILFNNAGIMHSDDDNAMTTSEAVWDLTFAINVKGVFLGCKYGIPALRRAGGGRSSIPPPSSPTLARRRRNWPTPPARARS